MFKIIFLFGHFIYSFNQQINLYVLFYFNFIDFFFLHFCVLMALAQISNLINCLRVSVKINSYLQMVKITQF